jgi:hypothetical protein
VYLVQRWLTNFDPFYFGSKNKGSHYSDGKPTWTFQELDAVLVYFAFSSTKNQSGLMLWTLSILTSAFSLCNLASWRIRYKEYNPFYLVSSALHILNIQ